MKFVKKKDLIKPTHYLLILTTLKFSSILKTALLTNLTLLKMFNQLFLVKISNKSSLIRNGMKIIWLN
jgi:hypothetical protein